MGAKKINFSENKTIQSLKFEDLSMCYPDQGFLFENLSLDFPLNDIVSIKGDRSSGRSVVLRILAGLVLPTSGYFKINEQVVSEFTFDEFLPYRLNIGFSFDYGGLINNLTVYENLILPLRYHKIKNLHHHEQVMRYLEIFGLVDFKDKRPSSISGGMKKEICVIRALILEPEVLLLDDPTTGMSILNKHCFFEIVKDRIENGNLKNVFITTEDQLLVEALVTKIMLIKDKKLKVLMD